MNITFTTKKAKKKKKNLIIDHTKYSNIWN